MRVQSFQDGVEFLGTPLKDLHSTRDEKVGEKSDRAGSRE